MTLSLANCSRTNLACQAIHGVVDLLAKVQPSVLKNKADFQLSSFRRVSETVFWRSAIVLEHTANPFKREDTDSLIQTIAARDRELAAALSNDWDTRPLPGCSRKHERSPTLSPKISWSINGSARPIIQPLWQSSCRFYQLLKAAQHG